MRGHSTEEMGRKGWLAPMELRRGLPWGSRGAPGNVRVVALLPTLPSFSLCGFLPPPSLAVWLEPRSLPAFLWCFALCKLGAGETEQEQRNMEGRGENGWASGHATGQSLGGGCKSSPSE